MEKKEVKRHRSIVCFLAKFSVHRCFSSFDLNIDVYFSLFYLAAQVQAKERWKGGVNQGCGFVSTVSARR